MKKGRVKLALVVMGIVFTLVLFASCFSSPPATNSTAEREYATVTFENQTGETIYYLYMSERTNDSWGSDWLGSSTVLSNGRTYTTRVLTGQYDIKVTKLNGDAIDTFWITVHSGANHFTIK